MTAHQSALYAGQVTHHRLRPKSHRLRYSLFYLLLDLDEVEMLAGSLRLFSHNAFNIFSFHDRDYGDGSAAPLRRQVENHLHAAGIENTGPILLLTMPRLLGYVFNPLSIYFCHRRDGTLSAILYEVNNTFGERHSYLIPVADTSQVPICQESQKSFYVSPFMNTDMTYFFVVTPPGENLSVCITGCDAEGPLIFARLKAARRTLTDTGLARAFAFFPFLTLKVIAGIHWEALLLWFKGIRLQKRPPPPGQNVTLGREMPLAAPDDTQEHRHVLPQ